MYGECKNKVHKKEIPGCIFFEMSPRAGYFKTLKTGDSALQHKDWSWKLLSAVARIRVATTFPLPQINTPIHTQ